jgi:hypothetical protein
VVSVSTATLNTVKCPPALNLMCLYKVFAQPLTELFIFRSGLSGMRINCNRFTEGSVHWHRDKKSGGWWVWRRSRHAVVPRIPFWYVIHPKTAAFLSRERPDDWKCARGEAAPSWVE